MKIKNMTVFALGVLLVCLGTLLSGYMADFKKDDSLVFDKSKLITEITEQKIRLIELKNDWNQKYKDSQSVLLKNRQKYSGKADMLKAKEEEGRQRRIQTDNEFRQKYNQNIKIKTKIIKKECELYLNVYGKTTVSYAEYDRVYGFYDLDNLINDLDYLETKLKAN